MEKYVIAIIDDGVMVNEGLVFNISITEQGKAEPFPVVSTERNLSHGTICYAIIKEYCPDSQVGSICIMETGKRGNPIRLIHAIQWCILQKIKFIHMSIGSEEMKDNTIIKEACLEYFLAGGIIIGALSNIGNITMPASFSFVFGVKYSLILAEGQFLLEETEDYADISIGAVTHIFWEKKYACVPCNSYSSPAFTAMLYSLMKNAKDKNTLEVRHGLLSKNRDFAIKTVQPDFIDNAIVIGQKGISKEEYFFKTLPMKYLWEDDKNKVNLVLFQNMEEWVNIYHFFNKIKLILYVGNMPAKMRNWCNQSQIPYWDEDSGEAAIQEKIRKVRSVKYQEDFDRWNRKEKPLIINMREIEGFWLLNGLIEKFTQEGYNVSALSTGNECYLYGISKVPPDYQMLKEYLLWLFQFGKLDIVFVDSLLLQEKDADLILKGHYNFDGVLYHEPIVHLNHHVPVEMAGRIFKVIKKILI